MQEQDAAGHLAAALALLGLDADHDPELRQTPRRVMDLWRAWLVPPPTPHLEPIAWQGTAEPVVVQRLAFHSLCVHHLVPFFGEVDLAYLPQDHIVGFGALGRVVDWASRRPQLQERLVEDIAGLLDGALRPRAVLVRCSARQMCMEMNGCPAHTTTVALASRGAWVGEGAARARQLFDRA
jgi:GTP cyclohydrolase I